MSKNKKVIKWVSQSGKNVSVEIELVLSERVWADGDEVVVNKCEINIAAEAEGMGCIGYGRPSEPVAAAKKALPGCAGMIGKLVIMPAEMDRINAAIAELESRPEWQAKIARQKQAEKESAEYNAHRAKMRKVMGY